ncbi:MAG: hypothetical protein J6R57_04190 [Bacteroidales bacterium]|nr:hypothetical protein [Bacteroidales bacterium]
MKKFTLILLAAASILAGCANYKQIRIEDINVGKLKMVALNAAQVDVDLEVFNPTKATFELAGVDIAVVKEGAEFAKITQVEGDEVLVAPGNPSKATLVLRAEVTDPMQVLATGLNPQKWNLDLFRANGAIWVKKGKMTKKIKVEDVPLKDLVDFLK